MQYRSPFRFIFIVVCLFTFGAQAQERKPVLNIQEVVSPEGLKAWLVEDHTVPVIALQFAFRDRGAKYDPDSKQGLARMASNTMDEGAGSLDSQAFQKQLQNLSITLYFNSSRDHFGGVLKTLTANKKQAADLLHLALTKPRFDTEAVERMRKANQTRIRSSLSDPDWMAARILNDKAYEGHSYALNSGGTFSSLQAITSEDLKEFSSTLARDDLIISAAGDITAEALSVMIDEIFGDLPARYDAPTLPDLSLQNQGEVFIYNKDIPQTVVEVVQPGIARTDSDYHAAQVMNFILGGSGFGSRLMEEVREKRGLSYGIYSYFSHMDLTDTFAVSTSTKNESVKDVLDLISAQWDGMRSEEVTDADIQSAQSYLIGSLPLSLTSTDKIAGVLLSLQKDGLPVDYLDRRARAINSTTPEDVKRVAERILDTEGWVTILVGRPEGINNATLVETLPNVE